MAKGVREHLDLTGEAVTVFDRATIEMVQGPDIVRLLERAPGVTVSRNGGPGAFTGISVRGAGADQLLVILDGVKVADPAAPGGGFDFGNLALGNLARVELLHSANSTIWGSQAIGGIIAASTQSGEGLQAEAEYGAFDSFDAALRAGFELGPAIFRGFVRRTGSDGFSATAAGNEPDGFRRTEWGADAVVSPAAGLTLSARGRMARARIEIDGFPAPDFTLSDTDEWQETRQATGIAALQYAAPGFQMQASYSLAETQRANFDPAFGSMPGFTTDGTSQRADMRGSWSILPELSLDFGAEREWLRFSTLFAPVRSTAQTGAYVQLDHDGPKLHLALGLRRDSHRDFGGEWSLGADLAYALTGNLRVIASYGEGFKAPSLFQLRSDYGNEALQPERSRGYEFGLALASGRLHGRISAFRRDLRSLIAFTSCTGSTAGICADRPYGTYDNLGRARAQGVDAEATWEATERLRLRAAYGYVRTADRTGLSANFGKDLARRPRHAATMSADWQIRDDFALGADLRIVSQAYDDPANAIRLRSFAVPTLRWEWSVAQSLTLYGRIENAWDEQYQTAAGYASPGRAAYIGARARF